jgi:hypothetical protein|tara:strand:- start:10 stop:531 length:522 start_codon:yes stop_codon:yes gene_type:complete
MPGSLVKIAESTVSSAVSSLTITGMDSTYDVYKIIYENMQGSVNDKYPQFRLTESGTANETSNYDYAAKKLKTYSSFQNVAQTNQNLARLTDEKLGDQAQETANGILYIFNASNSSEYTFWTMENVNRDGGGNLMSMTGGGVLTVTSAVDGIFFFIDASNIVSGTFKLYGLKK